MSRSRKPLGERVDVRPERVIVPGWGEARQRWAIVGGGGLLLELDGREVDEKDIGAIRVTVVER